MFFVYILQSEKDKNLYVGATNNLKRRLSQHQDGKVFATKLRRPFRLLYYEAYLAKGDAFRREHMLKLRGQARTQLLKRISECLWQNQS